MLSFKYIPSKYDNAFDFKYENNSNLKSKEQFTNIKVNDNKNNLLDEMNTETFKIFNNITKITDLYNNDNKLKIIKEKCDIDVHNIFKQVIPKFKQFVKDITNVSTAEEAYVFINNKKYFNIIKYLSENIIEIKKKNVQCINNNTEENKTDITNNAIDFNFNYTDNNIEITKKTINKYSDILISINKWMIESLVEVGIKSGFNKEKIDIILKLKDMLLYSLIDENFILEKSNKECMSKIDKIRDVMIEKNNIDMEKYIDKMKESCKKKCTDKIEIEKINTKVENDKICEEKKIYITEDIDNKNNGLKKELLTIKEETIRINEESNIYYIVTIIFILLFIIFFYLYYNKKK